MTEFFVKFIDLHRRKSLKTHFENGGGLLFVKQERVHKLYRRVVFILTALDYRYHFVDIRKRDNESFYDMFALFRFIEIESRSARDYVFLVSDVIFEYFF